MVAVVVSTDLADAIPLLDDDGAGVYKKGRNTAAEFQSIFMGGLFSSAAGSPNSNRSGILTPTAQTGGGWLDGRVISTGGAGTQAVAVFAYRAIIVRSGRPYLVHFPAGGPPIAAPAADGANARIDLFCVFPYDKGAFPADAQHGPKHIWVTGDPSGSPVIPALPATVSEALVLARVLRAAGDNTIADGDVTEVATAVSLHATPRPLINLDTVANAGGYHGEWRARTGSNIDAALVTRGHTFQFDYYDEANARWMGINAPALIDTRTASANGTLNTTEQMDVGASQTQITFNAVAGHKYKVRYELGHSVGAAGNRIICFPRYAAGGTVTTAGTLITSSRIMYSDTGFNFTSFTNIFTAPTTAQYTIGVGLKMYSGTSGTVYSTAEPDGNARTLTIEDGEF